MANFDFIGCAFPVLVAAFLFMPYLWLAGVYTIPEYLGRRYNQGVRTLVGIILTLSMVAMLGVILVSAAAMFGTLLGWSFTTSVVITACVVGLYTAFGGLKAVVYTDFVSCIVLIIGATLILVIGLHEVGGWGALRAKIAALPGTEQHFNMIRPADDPNYGWPAVLLGLGFVLGPAYWIGNQAIVQRTFGARSQSEARASYVLCAAIKTIFPLLLVVPGLIALALFHDKIGNGMAEDWKGGRVLPELVKLLPTGVLGIVMGAFLAGVMSNLDSYLNSASTLVVNDLYKAHFRKGASERETLFVGRTLMVAFLAGGIYIAYEVRKFGTVFEAFQTYLSLIQGSLLALLLLGMLTRRTTQWGGLAGLIYGVGAAVWMQQAGFHFLWVAWWSFVTALGMAVMVSLFTRPHSEDRLRGLVWFLPARPNNEEGGGA
jgi:SSS family solute:Na+ symporter